MCECRGVGGGSFSGDVVQGSVHFMWPSPRHFHSFTFIQVTENQSVIP